VRKNWFYVLYQRAVAAQNGRWAHFHATTHDNPHLSAEAVAELAEDMTEEAYRQEILAQFVEGQGQVFRNIEACATLQKRQPYPGEFVIGVDSAQKQDFTVACVIDAKTKQQVDMLRFNAVPWSVYRERIATLAQRWQARDIVFETNSIGGPNFEALADEGLPVVAFETTAKSKPPLIQSLKLAFERGEIGVLDDPILAGELGAYEYKVSSAGRPSYSAPEGLHDDCVMALALAWHGVVNATGTMYVQDNPFFQ
jgi:phage terminase large subunit-like protein